MCEVVPNRTLRDWSLWPFINQDKTPVKVSANDAVQMSNGAARTTDKEAECNEEETETDLFAELEDGLAFPDVNNMEQCIQFLTGNDNVHRDLSAAGERSAPIRCAVMRQYVRGYPFG